jgi:putative salt-induced outer membrane protein YdiY
MKKQTFFLLAMIFFTQGVSGGVIQMKNGDRITGSISKIWDGDVFIEPDYADEFSVDQVDIAYIEADREFDLELEDGTSVVGSLAGADAEGNQLIIVDGREQAIPMSSLTELEEPDEINDWAANADLNATFNSGNTNNSNVAMSVDFMIKRDRHTNFLDLLWQDEKQKIRDPDTGIEETTKVKDRDRYRYNYNYDVGDPWFIGSSASYERDPVKGLEYRYNVVPAAGYNFWDDAGKTLGFQIGAGYQAEEFLDDLGVKTEQDGAVGAFLLRYRYDFGSPDLEIYFNNSTVAAFYGRDNVVSQFNLGSKYEISDLLYFNLELLVDYETEPVEGAKNEDIALLVGFGLEFED